MWVANQTWPDVSFNVCRMSNTEKYLKVRLLFETNKFLLEWKSKTCSLSFPQWGKPADLKIVGYSDVTYASLEDVYLQGGFMIFVFGRMNRMAHTH